MLLVYVANAPFHRRKSILTDSRSSVVAADESEGDHFMRLLYFLNILQEAHRKSPLFTGAAVLIENL